jgi:hypothetical protein
MLGCHEFCGYYEWTFHFVRRKWGQEAVARLWAEAIGGESQQHYAEAGRRAGLAGLYRTWVKTGEDESCDWTFTLDEARNVLRWDMRQCPSKGFLLTHGLNADEDYCDHCTGWMIPLLKEVGVEVWEHEHNHLGQCWGTMRLADRPSEPIEVKADVRFDPRWNCGYLDRWEENRKQPLMPAMSGAVDPCQLLAEWFAQCDRVVVVTEDSVDDSGTDSARPAVAAQWTQTGGLMTDRAYVGGRESGFRPLAVLVGHEGAPLEELARKYHEEPQDRRPLLLHPYLPGRPALDLTPYRLPRPLPILPLLIRTGHYVHQPGGPEPDSRSLLVALADALGTGLPTPPRSV